MIIIGVLGTVFDNANRGAAICAMVIAVALGLLFVILALAQSGNRLELYDCNAVYRTWHKPWECRYADIARVITRRGKTEKLVLVLNDGTLLQALIGDTEQASNFIMSRM